MTVFSTPVDLKITLILPPTTGFHPKVAFSDLNVEADVRLVSDSEDKF